MPFSEPKLGVNIDHIATLRQLRGTPYPDIVEAAERVEAAGADQITMHLREDRRHIQDEDLILVRKKSKLPLNMEMGASSEMLKIALKVKPDWVCLVPEKRQEVTTEGGLNIKKNFSKIAQVTAKLTRAKIKVSFFIEPDVKAVQLSSECGAHAVEFHTGQYCLATQGGFGARSQKRAQLELQRLEKAALLACKLGLHAHAGHGFDYENVRPVVELERSPHTPLIEEYNIGHAIVCRAAMVGLEQAVREMVSAIRAP